VIFSVFSFSVMARRIPYRKSGVNGEWGKPKKSDGVKENSIGDELHLDTSS
jgi:hypothetical protein